MKLEKLQLIEYPALVKDVEQALNTLTFKPTEQRVELRLAQEKWRPSIIGDYQDCAGLLVCAKKMKKGLHEQNETVHIDLVGTARTMIRFRRAVDFISAPPPELDTIHKITSAAKQLDLQLITELTKVLSDPEWRKNEEQELGLLSYAPKRFTLSDYPFHRAIEGAIGTNSLGTVDSERRGRKGKHAPWVYFYAEQHQSAPEPLRQLALRAKRLYRGDFEAMTQLFQQRPIWLKSALHHYFPNLGPTEIRT